MHNTPIWEIHYMEPRCSSFDGIPWNFFDAAQSITLRFTKNNILEFQPPCWHVINDFIKSLSLWCFKIYVKKPAVIRWLTILGQGLQPAPQTFFATRWRWEFILLAFPVGETSNWVLKIMMVPLPSQKGITRPPKNFAQLHSLWLLEGLWPAEATLELLLENNYYKL